VTLFGFLNCNKPPGMTSRDVVNVVQRRLRKVKVGHAGTLDPLAEGVLVIGVGPAVRLVPYVQQRPKHYRATFRLGESTVSGDLEGQPTRHPELPIPTAEQIEASAMGLVGTIQQTPPAHSAVWIDGQRAYKRIRAGEDVQMPARTVTVYSIGVLRYEYPEIDLDIICGSGTYIRSIGLDLAVAAGSIAVMSHLCRIGVGAFELADSVTIQQLRQQDLKSMLVPPSVGVNHLPQIIVHPEGSERLGHGLCIEGQPTETSQTAWEPETEAAVVNQKGDLRAIVRRKNESWCPYRVFPTSQAPS
jgi:tRNA pseudouridine55 synthase